MEGSDAVLCRLTFYYNVLKLFSQKTGWQKQEFYLFGKKEGQYNCVDKNKILREEGYYFNGKLEKHVKHYNEKGDLTVFQEMDKGIRHGEYRVYKHKVLQREGLFNKGKVHGKHLCYEKGRIVDEVCYNQGEKISKHKYYSNKGYKLEEIVYKEEGFFDKLEFDSMGQKKYSGIWKEGVFYEKFYEEGKVTMSRKGKITHNKMIYQEDKL